ncbi:DUF6644 family protein [Paracoccus albus]|uniref:DUF6644 family protein n=1 Tax=Paracoccus albus TaxID=3017784 RepID=UPI0022F11FE2|nr:DUF6644 family protein [Paracoccus albus]WBU60574.1 hypothetical protein PAF20_01215 [Paracoccus albus]
MTIQSSQWFMDLLAGLEQSSLGVWVRSAPQAYPVLECIHILGIALLVGSALVVDLRLMGLRGRGVPVTTVTRNLLPLSHVGFAAVLMSGVLMFFGIARAVGFSAAAPWKLGLIALAGVNILVFHFGIYRSVSIWDQQPTPPIAARIAGGVSALSWIGVLVAGRYLAYV